MNIQEYKIKGWVVRDKDDYTAMYLSKDKLVRGKTEWNEYGVTFVNGEIKDSSFLCVLPYFFIPDLTFEDEPIEVELTIKVIECVNGEI